MIAEVVLFENIVTPGWLHVFGVFEDEQSNRLNVKLVDVMRVKVIIQGTFLAIVFLKNSNFQNPVPHNFKWFDSPCFGHALLFKTVS